MNINILIWQRLVDAVIRAYYFQVFPKVFNIRTDTWTHSNKYINK
jgi:hypothetical protein